MINESFITGFMAGLATALLLFGGLGLGFTLIRPWIRLKLTGGRGSLMEILAMRMRGTPPMMIIEAYTSLLHAGEEVRLAEVESQYVAHRTQIMDVRDLMKHVREYLRRREMARETAERN